MKSIIKAYRQMPAKTRVCASKKRMGIRSAGLPTFLWPIVARRTPMERHAPEEEETETEACRSAQGMMRPM